MDRNIVQEQAMLEHSSFPISDVNALQILLLVQQQLFADFKRTTAAHVAGEGGDDDVALGSLGDSGGHNFSASYGTANKTCPDEGGVQGPPASIGIDFPWDGIGVVSSVVALSVIRINVRP